jgi:hypothetical protein
MASIIEMQRDRALRELHTVTAEAVAAWHDLDLLRTSTVDRLVRAMDAVEMVLRGDPAPAKWVPEVCLEPGEE